MAWRQPGMVKILGRGMTHANRLHHPLRRQVIHRGKGHDLLQPELLEGTAQGRARRFAGEALAPVRVGQAPGDFHRWAERCLEADMTDTGEADKGAVVLTLQGPHAEAVLGEMPAKTPDHRRHIGAAVWRGEIAHHLRVRTERRKRFQVRGAPGTQLQPRAVQFNQVSHRHSA